MNLKLFATIATLALLAGCAAAPAPEDAPGAQTSGNQNVGQPINTNAAVSAKAQNPYAIPGSTTKVYGSGATFPKPILETWGLEFARLHSKVQVSYAGGGSGKGISDITAKNVLFGGSDAPLTDAEQAKVPGILHIPETLGLVCVVYNVDGLPNGLKFDGPTIGKIFLGQIKKWNDPAIAALNPGVTLPDLSIAIVYRSDSSGTTFVYTDFLTRTSPDWQGTMGTTPSKKPDWTKSGATQLSGPGNDGVGSTVKSTPNSIGYVEYAYVKSLGLKAGHILNAAGEYVAPSGEGATKAAAGAVLPEPSGDWSDVSISNAAGPGVYPISSFSYLLVYDTVEAYGGKVTSEQMNAFRAWLWWATHDGQSYADKLGYAPLPSSVVTVAEQALEKIRV